MDTEQLKVDLIEDVKMGNRKSMTNQKKRVTNVLNAQITRLVDKGKMKGDLCDQQKHDHKVMQERNH